MTSIRVNIITKLLDNENQGIYGTVSVDTIDGQHGSRLYSFSATRTTVELHLQSNDLRVNLTLEQEEAVSSKVTEHLRCHRQLYFENQTFFHLALTENKT
jgi:hypothetical protein